MLLPLVESQQKRNRNAFGLALAVLSLILDDVQSCPAGFGKGDMRSLPCNECVKCKQLREPDWKLQLLGIRQIGSPFHRLCVNDEHLLDNI